MFSENVVSSLSQELNGARTPAPQAHNKMVYKQGTIVMLTPDN